MRSEDKTYRIAFERGLVVAASSPLPADAVTRIALTNRHIAASQVNEIKRCIAAAPNLDEVDVLVAAAKLDAEAARTLRHQVIRQRAARTFSLDQGEYEIEDRMPVAATSGGVDVRSVIFVGARLNLSEDRLRVRLREIGPRFVLKPGEFEQIERYDFSQVELPLVLGLRSCTSLAELEASHRDIDPRGIQAVIYALSACDALTELDLAPEHGLPPLVVEPPVTPVVTYPDAPRTATRSAGLRADDPTSTARVPTVQITERVRTPSKLNAISRDELPPERAKAATLTPPSKPVTKPPPVARSKPPSAAPVLPTRDESQAKALAELSLAQGTPSIDATVDLDDISETSRAFDDVTPEPRMVDDPLGLDIELGHLDLAGAPVDDLAVAPAPGFALELTPVPVLDDPPPAAKPDPVAPGMTVSPRQRDRSMLDTFKTNKVTTVRPNALQRHEVIALINERTQAIARGVDHFTLLGLPFGAEIEEVHAAYVELSRNLRAPRLAELGIKDEAFMAASLLAQIGIAFTVLTDRLRRPEYIATLRAKQR